MDFDIHYSIYNEKKEQLLIFDKKNGEIYNSDLLLKDIVKSKDSIKPIEN